MAVTRARSLTGSRADPVTATNQSRRRVRPARPPGASRGAQLQSAGGGSQAGHVIPGPEDSAECTGSEMASPKFGIFQSKFWRFVWLVSQVIQHQIIILPTNMTIEHLGDKYPAVCSIDTMSANTAQSSPSYLGDYISMSRLQLEPGMCM